MNVLITGASGFTGHHLIHHLLSQTASVDHIWGLSRHLSSISHTKCTPVCVDLGNTEDVERLMQEIKPDAVIHLAGLNRGSLEDLLQSNVMNTGHLLDAVRMHAPGARVLVVSSSAVYGYAGDSPIPEDAPFRPVGAYGISKAAEELLAFQCRHVYNLNVAVARPFNLIGPGQPESFLCGRLTRQAVEIHAGKRHSFNLTGGDARRDYIDVRDVVDAYWRLISHQLFTEHIAGRVFNIGSERSYSVSELISAISEIMNTSYTISLQPFEAELVPIQVADTARLRGETGWYPLIDIRRSLEDMIEYAKNL